MPQPLNSAAETIVLLTSQNADIGSQIETLQATQARNQTTIDALAATAEWEDDE